MSRQTNFAMTALTGVLGLLGAAGCEATFTPAQPVYGYYDGTVVAATEVPVDVWGYPRVYYGGGYAYLVNGLWYQPTARGWVVFRREPVELSRERTRIYAARPAVRMTVRPAVRTPVYAYPRPVTPREPNEYQRRRTLSPP